MSQIAMTCLLAAGLLVPLLGCGKPAEDGAKEVQFGQKVHGKVTYKGEPVCYGAVIFYSLQNGFNPEHRTFTPLGSAIIGPDGAYDCKNVAIGQMLVVVATDPDQEPRRFIRPARMGMDRPEGQDAPLLAPPDGTDDAPKVSKEPMRPPHLKKKNAPAAAKLTEEQKKTLKEIHQKYGALGMSDLQILIFEGEQTFDIELK